MNIDWSKAPDGATHAGLETEAHHPGFYKVSNGRVTHFCAIGERGWLEGEDGCPPVACLIRRPVMWDGQGLPPAETVVELRTVSAQTDWAKAKIKFASRNVVVWDWDEEPALNGLCTAYAHAIEIRPVRTAEQIAAEEREKAMAEMVEAIRVRRFANGTPSNPKEEAFIAAEALYDAGYRKQVQP